MRNTPRGNGGYTAPHWLHRDGCGRDWFAFTRPNERGLSVRLYALQVAPVHVDLNMVWDGYRLLGREVKRLRHHRTVHRLLLAWLRAEPLHDGLDWPSVPALALVASPAPSQTQIPSPAIREGDRIVWPPSRAQVLQ